MDSLLTNLEQRLECDLTAVVVARDEGLLLHPTLRSLKEAVKQVAALGIQVEVMVALDAPTGETREYVDRFRDQFRVLEFDSCATGSSLNRAVESARGKYVCIVEASALVSHGWLSAACEVAGDCQLADFVIHPAASLEFGESVTLHEHRASNSKTLPLSELLHRGLWTSVFLTPRTTLLKLPFCEPGQDSGFGYADRHWYCNFLAAGGQVLIAPETSVFIRNSKSERISSASTQSAILLRPTAWLEPKHYLIPVQGAPSDSTPLTLPANTQQPQSLTVELRKQVDSTARRISALTEKHPALQKSLGYLYRKVMGADEPTSAVPAWLLAQWKSIAEIEPGMFPDRETLSQLERVSIGALPETTVYESLCRLLATQHRNVTGPQFTHVYLLPWLKRGGAEHVAIHYILAVASCRSNRVLVVLTEGSEAPWKDRLPPAVEILDYWGISQHLEPKARQRLLSQLLVQLQPSVIHIVSSQLGSQIFRSYGRALSDISRLYAPAFCADVSPEGKLLSYVVTYLPEYARYLTAIHSDNQRVLCYLEETFALDPAKMFVHYQPVQIKETTHTGEQPSRTTLQVLWAGRLDRQKRPDLLLAIADLCQSADMHFHVYGSSLLPWDKAKVAFDGKANVTYHGPFDGLSSLPTADYDVFLNTSQWDGMPNILLEAASVGLPIVSSNVGGISELIQNDETGLLVTPFDDVPQFVNALQRLQQDPELRRQFSANCRQLVADRHSWAHFAADLDLFPGYCDQPIDVENVFIRPTQDSRTTASRKTLSAGSE